jgi:hypothetical protein
MREKIILTFGCVFAIVGLYAFWFAISLGMSPLASGGAWLIETKSIYLVFIAIWLAGISAIAYIKSR